MEDTMFFTRLRRHTKWVFVFLAFIFASGFVVAGVGSGTGFGDVLGQLVNGRGSSAMSKAQDAVKKNPKNAAAWKQLAGLYSSDSNKLHQSIDAYQRYLKLKPHDSGALGSLGSVWHQIFIARENVYLTYATQAQELAPPTDPISGFSSQITQNALAEAAVSQATQQAQSAQVRASTALTNWMNAYKQAVKVVPASNKTGKLEALVQLESQAEQGGQLTTAIGAFRQYLALAPNGVNSRDIRSRLKQLDKVLVQQGDQAKQSGDTAGAISAYEQYVKLAPNGADIRSVKKKLAALRKATSGR
ncbi:MAG: tetratricopeptide repeat protein [Gaiellaceae bacterium]